MLSWRKSEELEGGNKADSLCSYIIHVSHIQIKFIPLSIIVSVCVCVHIDKLITSYPGSM